MTLPPFSRIVLMLGLMALIAVAFPLAADEVEEPDSTSGIKKREPSRFVRVRYDEYQNPVALQTATAKYVLESTSDEPSLEVFLEAVIHVADRTYYRGFNQRFRHYDVVLYEFIAPPENRVPDPGRMQPDPLRLLQQVAADGLGFAHQIDEIDYRAPGLVHSDLSPAEMHDVMKSRGEDEFTQLVDMLVDTMRRVNRDRIAQDGEPDQEMALDLSVLSDPDGAIQIRRLLARGFGTQVSLESVLPPAQIATLIRARNQRAMDIFQQQVDSGKRRIAFFWGAGHMQDFERELILSYGVDPAGIIWRDAWDLREGAVQRAPLEAILEDSLRGTLKDAVQRLLTPPEPDNP